MYNSMTVEGSVSFATLDVGTAAYIEGLPGGLEVTLDLENNLMAHIKYTDGFPTPRPLI